MPKNIPLLKTELLPVYFIDYIFVMTLYVVIAFFLAVIIDGYILEEYNEEKIKKLSTGYLMFFILFQLILQGFLVICIIYLLRYIPSPVSHMYKNNYKITGPEGLLIRNPAIISVLLFVLSIKLKARLYELYKRFSGEK